MKGLVELFLLLANYLIACHCRMTCLDEDGKPVDMYILYKLPEESHVFGGHGYLYLDVNKPSFRLSSFPVNSSSSAPGRTLNQVYQKYDAEQRYFKNGTFYENGPSDVAHIFYNDEPPFEKTVFDCGHTKGAVAFDKESGFWLITSVPKYPYPVQKGYDYPPSGREYGQMFMCVTFNVSKFDDIGYQLRFNDPHIYDQHLPQGWEQQFPNINSAIQGDTMGIKSPRSNEVKLISIAGIEYIHFAKSGYFRQDLYYNFVAPSLQSALLTETWQHGKNIGPSCATNYTVNDICNLLISLEAQKFSIKFTQDHSKFVVTASKNRPYICVGDINRQPSQFHRGGGTMCVKNTDLWNQYTLMISTTSSCGGNGSLPQGCHA